MIGIFLCETIRSRFESIGGFVCDWTERAMNVFLVVWLAVLANVSPALAQVPFYQDKTTTVILGGPGVQYDLDKLVYLGTPTARSIISL